MTEKTVEQLEAEQKAAEKAAEQKVEAAGKEAKEQAENKGLSSEEVQAAVEKARKEEKDKLYPQIEELRSTVKDLQSLVRQQQEEREAEERKREEEKEKRRLAKLSDEEKQSERLQKLEEQLNQEREARERSEAQLASEKRQQQLNDYRKTAIKLAGEDTLIPEMVGGKSEDEIDESIRRAQVKYEEIKEKLKEEQGQRVRSQMSGTTSPGLEALEEEELDKRLSAVDTDKYLKDPEYRAQIQATLENEYAKAAGR